LSPLCEKKSILDFRYNFNIEIFEVAESKYIRISKFKMADLKTAILLLIIDFIIANFNPPY